MANHKHRWVRIKESPDDYRVSIAAGKKTAVFMYLPEKMYWQQKVRMDLKKARRDVALQRLNPN